MLKPTKNLICKNKRTRDNLHKNKRTACVQSTHGTGKQTMYYAKRQTKTNKPDADQAGMTNGVCSVYTHTDGSDKPISGSSAPAI